MIRRKRKIRDVSRVSNATVLRLGLSSGCAVTGVAWIMRSADVTRLDFEMLLGTLLTGRLNAASWWLGFSLHLIASGLIGFVYAFIFRSARRSGVGVGLNLALYHWAVAGLLAGFLPTLHPLMETPHGVPSIFFANTAMSTSLTFFIMHLIYGGCFGALFDLFAQTSEYPKPITA